MIGSIDNLYHYPIKGLSPQMLAHCELTAGNAFPHDRMFGFARYDSGFRPEEPQILPKDRFIVLVKEERLAGLETSFDPDTRDLTIRVQGRTVFEERLTDEKAIEAVVSFFTTMFDLGATQKPIFAHAAPHRFTDVSVVSEKMMNAVSLINLESVQDLAHRTATPIDPLRFRANIYFSGWPALSELEMVGREFIIGEVRMKIVRRTRRCAATEVDPRTGKRDLPIPKLLVQNYGHPDMGVYAQVLSNGTIRSGDVIKLLEHDDV